MKKFFFFFVTKYGLVLDRKLTESLEVNHFMKFQNCISLTSDRNFPYYI